MAFRFALTPAMKPLRSLAVKRAAGASTFTRNQRRLVSHYNVSLAGLTEEQAEVRAVQILCSFTLNLPPSRSAVPGGRSPVRQEGDRATSCRDRPDEHFPYGTPLLVIETTTSHWALRTFGRNLVRWVSWELPFPRSMVVSIRAISNIPLPWKSSPERLVLSPFRTVPIRTCASTRYIVGEQPSRRPSTFQISFPGRRLGV